MQHLTFTDECFYVHFLLYQLRVMYWDCNCIREELAQMYLWFCGENNYQIYYMSSALIASSIHLHYANVYSFMNNLTIRIFNIFQMRRTHLISLATFLKDYLHCSIRIRSIVIIRITAC